jgi:hypothetical protein
MPSVYLLTSGSYNAEHKLFLLSVQCIFAFMGKLMHDCIIISSKCNLIRESEGTKEALEHAERLLSRLQVTDHIRVKYWSRRAQHVRERMAGMHAS